MCSGSSAKTEEPSKAGGSVPDAITRLRSAEANLHFGAPLRLLGAVLLVAGCLVGSLRFLLANSYILLVLLGLLFLTISVVADPRGLLRLLPAEAQDFLFNRRVFDLLYDDTPVVNAVRKWGRVQLLLMQDGSSAGAIRRIVKGIDGETLRMLLCRNFLSFLPGVLRLLLLPSSPPGFHRLVGSEASASCGSGADAAGDSRPSVDDIDDGSPPSVEWIQGFIQQRNEWKQRSFQLPELMPVVTRTLGESIAMVTLRASSRSFLRWTQALAATMGVGCLLSAGIFFHSGGRALQSLAAGGLIRTPESSSKTSRMVAALSLMSAGGSIALALFCQRCSRFIEGPKKVNRLEPEREVPEPPQATPK